MSTERTAPSGRQDSVAGNESGTSVQGMARWRWRQCAEIADAMAQRAYFHYDPALYQMLVAITRAFEEQAA